MNASPIINRVDNSSLISIDLEDIYDVNERVIIDLKDVLFQEMVLREKDFREFVRNEDWSKYAHKNVGIICSVEAIIPTWAYMLLISKIEPFASAVVVGDKDKLEEYLFQRALNKLDLEAYKNKKLVIKGCSGKPVPAFAYAELTRKLRPIASSIMFGEPCSTVPVYKRPKTTNE
jgi:hypothetical protein